MSPAGGNGPTFRISHSRAVGQAFRRLFLRALLEGRGPAVRAAYEALHEALRLRARDAGEPRNELRVMRLQLRVAAVAPLVVEYAVHHALPLVFLRRFHLMAGPGD